MDGTVEALNIPETVTIGYVDVGRKKPHTVHVDGRVFQTDDLGKLENSVACLDVLFPSIFHQVRSLLSRGTRVYILTDMRLLETLRRQNNIEKSDENDARILTLVPSEGWKELTKNELELRSLLHQYYMIADNVKRNKQWYSLAVDAHERALVKERISFHIRQRDAVGRTILQTARKTLPYDYVNKKLGIGGVSLVAVLTYVDFSKTFRQLARFAGFVDPTTRNGSFNRKVRRALSALAAVSIRDAHVRYSEVYGHYLRTLGNRNRALLRVQKKLLKDLWQTLRRARTDKAPEGSTTRGKD